MKNFNNYRVIIFFLIVAGTIFAQSKISTNYNYEEEDFINPVEDMIKMNNKVSSDYRWTKTNVTINYNPDNFSFSESFTLFNDLGLETNRYLRLRGSDGLRPYHFLEFTYDSNNNLIEGTRFIWDANGERIIQSNNKYYYNNNGLLVTDSTFTFNPTNNSFLFESVENFTYSDTLLITKEKLYYYGNDQVTNKNKYEYNYHTNGDLSDYSYYTWNGSQYNIFYQYFYYYNAPGGKLSEIERYRASNGILYQDSKTSYIYNNQLQLIEVINQQIINGSYENTYKNEYTYIEDVYSKVEYFRWDGNWSLWTTTNYDYGNTPFIEVINPLNKQNIPPSSIYHLDWFSYDLSNIDIFLLSGGNETPIAENVTSTSQFVWNVPSNETTENQIMIRSSSNSSISSLGENIFSILDLKQTVDHITQNLVVSDVAKGYWGSNESENLGNGVKYKGNANTLFSGGFIAGIAEYGISGVLGSHNIWDTYNISEIKGIFSEDNFSSVSSSVFGLSRYPFGDLIVGQKLLSNTDDDFVFIVYDVINESTNLFDSLYLGIFADWDVGNYNANTGGFVSSNNLVYVYDVSGTDPYYYGILPLNNFHTATVAANVQNTGTNIYDNFTNQLIDSQQGDQRMYISAGPFNIGAKEKQKVSFAILAAENLNDLSNNANKAQVIWNDILSEVKDVKNETPSNFSLKQNYPNPFNPSTVIEYSVPSNEYVSLKIYDLLGREVATLVNEQKSAGNYTVNFNASKLSSGIYFCTIQAGNFNKVRKMLLIK